MVMFIGLGSAATTIFSTKQAHHGWMEWDLIDNIYDNDSSLQDHSQDPCQHNFDSSTKLHDGQTTFVRSSSKNFG